jgi:glycine cleavage system H protein
MALSSPSPGFPADCRYADSHEYLRPEGELLRLGISAFAVEQLGDIVFVELPEPGSALGRGTSFGTVESVKAVEEVYAPIDGTVVERNGAVLDNPEQLQNDPHGEGWLLVVRPSDPSQIDALMDAATYGAKVAGH